jgi:PPOX class probable F420-dependent enzyme
MLAGKEAGTMQSSGSEAQGAAGGRDPSAVAVERVREIAAANNRAIFATARRDGSIQATMVRVSLMAHPLSGQPTVVVMLRPDTVKLRNLRRNPRATVCLHAGAQWVTVEGRGTLLGPEDAAEGLGADHYREVRRAHYLATVGAGESQEAWDLKMGGERGALVFVTLERVYTNASIAAGSAPGPG